MIEQSYALENVWNILKIAILKILKNSIDYLKIS